MNIIMMVIVGILSAVFGVLLTYFITSLSQRNIIETLVKKMVTIHEEIHHKKSMEKQIEKHKNECIANKGFSDLRSALIFLVMKQGGNPKDLGL